MNYITSFQIPSLNYTVRETLKFIFYKVTQLRVLRFRTVIKKWSMLHENPPKEGKEGAKIQVRLDQLLTLSLLSA